MATTKGEKWDSFWGPAWSHDVFLYHDAPQKNVTGFDSNNSTMSIYQSAVFQVCLRLVATLEPHPPTE